MPSLVGTTVAANYLKADPSSQFGTRQLSVLNIAQSGVDTDFADADSLYSKSVRALQQTAEVYAIFTPTSGAFNVIIATDTQWAGDTAHQGAVNGGSLPTQGYGVLEAAILAGSGTAATVTAVAGCVAAFNG